MLPVRLIWMALSTLTLLAGWLFSSKTKRQSATNQNAEFNYDGESHDPSLRAVCFDRPDQSLTWHGRPCMDDG